MKKITICLVIILLSILIFNQVLIAYNEINNIKEGDRWLNKINEGGVASSVNMERSLVGATYYLREIALQLRELNKNLAED